MCQISRKIKVLLISAALLLGGCATFDTLHDEMEEAEAKANATPTKNLPSLVVEVDDVALACKSAGLRLPDLSNHLLHGCAEIHGKYEKGYCTIFVVRGAPLWVIFHEKLHCIYGYWHS